MKWLQRLTLFIGCLTLLPAHAITLKEAIEDAIIHNPQFREQVKSYRANEAELDAAKGRYLPSVDINAGIGYEEVNSPSRDNRGDGLRRREFSIKFTENLFEGFATNNEIKRQQYRKDAQAYKVIATANEVATSMAESFVTLIKHEELLKLSKDNLETHKKILDQIVKREEAGVGNQVEVDQARARFALAQSNYATAQNDYFDAQAQFRRTLGRDQDNDLVRPKFRFDIPTTLKEATNIALLDHPTLRSANGDIAEARLQFEASKAIYYPKVDLEVEQTLDHNLGGVKGHNENFQAMVRLKWNLYNGGADSAITERTASNYHQAVEIRNNTRRQIIENLRYAWNAHTYINKQMVYVNEHIKLTYDTLTGYRKQFNLGRRSLLDLLNTENEYVSALKTLINSEADALIAKYKILSATGHLLDKMKIDYSFIAEENHPDE